MSGRDAPTELEAAARRLAALADRLRAVRAQLGSTAGAPSPLPEGQPPPEEPKGEAH